MCLKQKNILSANKITILTAGPKAESMFTIEIKEWMKYIRIFLCQLGFQAKFIWQETKQHQNN